MVEVTNGSLPLVVHVDQADAIAHLLRLRAEIAPAAKLTVYGGAEAHLLASELAAAGVAVILAPPRARPRQRFDTYRAVDLAAGEVHAALQLARAGVTVGLAGSSGPTTNLRWEAGLVRATGASKLEAMKMATRNLATALHLPSQLHVGTIAVGARAAFALYSGDPLSTDSEVLLTVGGRSLSCSPPATPWDLPWKPGGAAGTVAPKGADLTFG